MSGTTGVSGDTVSIASIDFFREQAKQLSRSIVASFGLSEGHAIPMYLNAVLMELDRLRKETKA